MTDAKKKNEKNILLLTTGGTIASLPGENGLEPQLDGDDLLRSVRGYYPQHTFACKSIMKHDSSNIQPEHWQVLARAVHEVQDLYDGVIVTHGTDTMAYTAAALSFMIRNLNKPVVLTGSQIPASEPASDAPGNLHTAIAAVECGIRGVTVAFAGRVINGTRAVKTSTMGMAAFESVNAPLMAEVKADGMRVYATSTALLEPGSPPKLDDRLCTDVCLVKLVPGTKPELFDALLSLKYRGVVIEAFGAGGVHYIERNLVEKIDMLRRNGVVVAVCSQCLYERVDLTVYEVGSRLVEAGVIPCADMTTEAVVTKLMWALGRALERSGDADPIAEVGAIFATGYAGEISLK
ncbi:asparaginase [Synergistaceae bacterium OttesenSCG-928-I11]|nr:asparaginase [Synergistaceae bacterium OttesenSCG-928-I11]